MKTGYLSTIRWLPFPADREGTKEHELAGPVADDAVVRAFLTTGIPQPPMSMSVLDEAKFFLRCAAEIEHGLLIQYLYALYSLNVDVPIIGENWTGTLRDIAIEEMGHLLTVQNMLLAVGAEPHFDRQYLATDPFPFQLEPLSRASLAKYVTTESPGAEKITDPGQHRRVLQIESVALQAAQNPEPTPAYDPTAEPLTIRHVGGLYAWLYWLFLPNDTIQGRWTDLPTQPFPPGRHLRVEDFDSARLARQARVTKADWNGFGSEEGPVFIRQILSYKPADPNGALETIYRIATQGEGFVDTKSETEKSHFQRFYEMYLELEKLEKTKIRVSRKLATSPSVHRHRAGRTIRHPVAIRCAKLFNARYEMLLLKLSCSMKFDSGNVVRKDLIRDLVDSEMLQILKPIADLLTRLPLKPRHAGVEPEDIEFAGPTFELPDDPLPTEVRDIKARLLELNPTSEALEAELMALKPKELGEDAVDLARCKKQLKDIFDTIRTADKKLKTILKKIA